MRKRLYHFDFLSYRLGLGKLILVSLLSIQILSWQNTMQLLIKIQNYFLTSCDQAGTGNHTINKSYGLYRNTANSDWTSSTDDDAISDFPKVIMIYSLFQFFERKSWSYGIGAVGLPPYEN